jgi:hypothetical protein
MKLSMVYDPKDTKLVDISYSQAYKDQFLALIERFDEVRHITESCSAEDIDGDVIIFYDPHSGHNIDIDGIGSHKSLKYTYMDDPHQYTIKGRHNKTKQIVTRLGPKDRLLRAIKKRGVDYIICPYTDSYHRHFGPILNGMAEKMHVWFPVCSNPDRYLSTPLALRKPEVLANGAVKHLPGFRGYDTRRWAFKRPEVTFVPHCKNDSSTPRGLEYPKLLIEYAGALAICDTQIVPKYVEIPLAGCVCFATYQEDYEKMGFRDGVSCVYVDKNNFEMRINDFKNNVGLYQDMADAGRKLILDNWTAKHFAEHIYNHAKGVIDGY